MAREATILVRATQTEWAGSWGDCFARGLAHHGWRATARNDYAKADLVMLWGVARRDLIDRALKDGCEVCVLERSYLQDRFKYASVSFGGGLNGRGIFRGPFHDGSRFEKHFSRLLQPWRPKADGYALIMEQVPGDNSVKNVDLPGFYARARQVFERHGIPVRPRAHPNASPKRGQDYIDASYRSLAEDLAGARFAVTWNSNAGVDAVLAGIPAISMDEGSMAWDVTGHELKEPPMLDRTAWAHALAWKQWTKEEIASGECWANVKGDL